MTSTLYLLVSTSFTIPSTTRRYQLVDDLVATNNHLSRLASGVDEFALMDNSLFCSATVSKAERDIVIYGYTYSTGFPDDRH